MGRDRTKHDRCGNSAKPGNTSARHAICGSSTQSWVISQLASSEGSFSFQLMRKIHYTLYREESDYVAQCLDFDVSSFGATQQEALLSLTEAVELFLEDR